MLVDGTSAVGIDIVATVHTGGHPIDGYAESYRSSLGYGSKDEMQARARNR
jgi:hypothetical protein